MMLYIQKLINKKISLLGIIKIGIIILTSVYLIGTFEPFYSGVDPYLIGLRAVDIAEGSYEFTNEFLQKDLPGFLPNQHVKTIYHTIIPIGAIGMFGLSAFSYLLGGYFALFYLGPIITILFLITSERVVTKLFGSFVGFVTLIFL